jgi:hypothetical protein
MLPISGIASGGLGGVSSLAISIRRDEKLVRYLLREAALIRWNLIFMLLWT